MKQTDYKLSSWQKQLAAAFSNVEDLCCHLNISVDDLPIIPFHKPFPMKVPQSFVDCMERGNPNDPLLRQILPLQQELFEFPGFTADPVGDMAAVAETGIIHKYRGRALLMTTGACAINCRYCFRRNFPYTEVQLTPQRESKALAYLNSHTDITEVILSGGDPLIMNDDKFSTLIHQLEHIHHLKRIRIHSRLPVVLPARITPALLQCLKQCQKQIIVVIHANHSHELSHAVKQACLNLKENGATLLNQSVLLKGVNDSVITLCELSERLFSLGVLPYYLHVLDKAHGTRHFEISQEQALLLMEHVKKQLPGYLVPKLVKEVAGAPNKLTIC